MSEPSRTAASEYPRARFSDRLNAFVVDASLFSAAYLTSALVIGAARRAVSVEFGGIWLGVWVLAFVLYHAYFGAEGRQTVGKRAFGLAVVKAADGEPPGIGASFARTLCYGPSSLLLNLGFLWALKPHGRAWHDLLAGTRVVEISARSGAFRSASAVSSWLLAAGLIVAWLGVVVVGPGLARMRVLAAARTGLKSLAYLQEEHKRTRGVYATDLEALIGGDSPEAGEVRRALRFHLKENTVRLSVNGDTYEIEAEAHDEDRTVLRLSGPATGP